MRRAIPLIAGTAVLVLPRGAQANAGIGFFLVSVPFVAMATAPAILVEAPILSLMLGVGLARGLWWSLCANLASTVLGSLLAIAADAAFVIATGSSGLEASRPTVLLTLVPMFWLTWLLERSTVRRLQPAGAEPSAGRATLVANGVSYALLALAVAGVPSSMLDAPTPSTRYRIIEAVTELYREKVAVAEHYASHKRFPAAGPVSPTSPYLQSLRRDDDGRITGVINYPRAEAIHGKSIVVAPRVEGGVIAEWRCYTPDAPHGFLPAGCRNGPPDTLR